MDMGNDRMGVSYWCYQEHGYSASAKNYDVNGDGDTIDAIDEKRSMDFWMQNFKDNVVPYNYPKWWIYPGIWGDV